VLRAGIKNGRRRRYDMSRAMEERERERERERECRVEKLVSAVKESAGPKILGQGT
jgi:hypothetical protein